MGHFERGMVVWEAGGGPRGTLRGVHGSGEAGLNFERAPGRPELAAALARHLEEVTP